MKMMVVVLDDEDYKDWKNPKRQNTFRDTYSSGSEEENSNSGIVKI